MTGATASAGTITTAGPFPEDKWVHVAMIHSGGVATIYWDGLPKATGPIPMPPPVLRTQNYIGKSPLVKGVRSKQKDDDSWPRAFGGEMRDLAWYTAPAITIDQIRANPNASNRLELWPVLSAGRFIPMAQFHATGPSGWLPLRANHSVSSGSPIDNAANAFDGFASTAVHEVRWVEHALPTPVAVDRYYVLAAGEGCPPAWEFQAHQCNYSQRVPYKPYTPACAWLTLDARRGERCHGGTPTAPATFHNVDNRRAYTHYRWVFSHASTVAELGMGHSDAATEEHADYTVRDEGRKHEMPGYGDVNAKVDALTAKLTNTTAELAEMKELLADMKEDAGKLTNIEKCWGT